MAFLLLTDVFDKKFIVTWKNQFDGVRKDYVADVYGHIYSNVYIKITDAWLQCVIAKVIDKAYKLPVGTACLIL